MDDASDKACALIDIALSTYREEIQPGLPKGKRYTGAMIANAIGIAARRLASDDPDERLLAELGRDGDLAALVRDIRSGAVGEKSHPGLGRALFEYVQAELAITNPRLLKRRRK